MEFLQNNWFWIVVLGFFIWMNLNPGDASGLSL